MQLTIVEIVERVTKVTPYTKCEEVYKSFKEIPSLEGVVVSLEICKPMPEAPPVTIATFPSIE